MSSLTGTRTYVRVNGRGQHPPRQPPRWDRVEALAARIETHFKRLDALIDGREYVATAGDLIRLPMNIPHGLFNKSEQPIKCLFWVTPTRKLYDLFWAIHGMKEQNPPDVVALAAKHEVVFLPPPEA